jgi:hypothetical protein
MASDASPTLRFSPLGDLVDEQGEIIDPRDLNTDQLVELDRLLIDLYRCQRAAKHALDSEIVRRLDAAIDSGEMPEQYTFETERFKVAVTSRRSAMRTDETALRQTLLERSGNLGLVPLRIERLFTPKGWKRNERFWKQFAAEVPEAEMIRAQHTMPTTRSVTKIERLPHVRQEPTALEVETA